MAHDPWSALRNREYRSFLLGVGAGTLAGQIQTTVLSWQVWELTGNPFWLGMIGLSEAIPFLSLALWGGWEADRRDRRTIVLWSLAASALSSLALLAAASLPPPPVRATGQMLTGLAAFTVALPCYAAQALGGVARAFFRPAANALGTELIPRDQYQNAASWRSAVFQGATVAGPGVGGLLLLVASPRVSYALVLALVVASIACYASLRPRPRGSVPDEGILAGLADGIRFVLGKPLLVGAMTLDLFAVLFGGAVALLPAFAELLHAGKGGLGILRAAPALGSVLMGLAVARAGELRRAGPVLLWCVAFFGVTWVLFALSPWFWVSVALLVAGGALDCISMVVRGTLVQTSTPQDKMGRVSAVNALFIGSSNEVGEFESGVTARLLGLVPSVIFGGTMTLVTVATVAWRLPALRRLRRIGVEEAPAPPTPSAP